MNISLLFQDIETLPSNLQQQVADFVLQLKKRLQENDQIAEFSEVELGDFDRRVDFLRQNPSSGHSISDLKNWAKNSHGL